MKILEFIEFLKCRNEASNINILDVGCGNGETWWELYEKLQFNKIIGIDNRSQLTISKGGYSPISFNTYCKRKELTFDILNEKQFNDIFQFYQIGIDDFFQTTIYKNNKFELIIMSNFLYLFEESKAKEILEKIKLIIKDEGYLYIQIGSKPWQKPNRPDWLTGEEGAVKFGLSEDELLSWVTPLSCIKLRRLETGNLDILCKKTNQKR